MRHLAVLLLSTIALVAQADEAGTAKAFQNLRKDSWRLRQFMAEFPKGGDLHNHLDGSIYAENIIKWSAEDGKCVVPITGQISYPPCDTSRPAMKDYAADSVNYRQLVDAYSVRN
jgi:adenosine deaminase